MKIKQKNNNNNNNNNENKYYETSFPVLCREGERPFWRYFLTISLVNNPIQFSSAVRQCSITISNATVIFRKWPIFLTPSVRSHHLSIDTFLHFLQWFFISSLSLSISLNLGFFGPIL